MSFKTIFGNQTNLVHLFGGGQHLWRCLRHRKNRARNASCLGNARSVASTSCCFVVLDAWRASGNHAVSLWLSGETSVKDRLMVDGFGRETMVEI